jgi:hypothetical protein
MKRTLIVLACLAILPGITTTTQAQDTAKSDSKILLGVGFGARSVTGDTPAPRVGETANLTQFGVHAVYALNPKFAIVGDWAYGFRTLSYTASSSSSTIKNKSTATGWALNGLFAATQSIGSNGAQLYFGPGLALIKAVFDITNDDNGTVTVKKAHLGTNIGFVVGAGAIVPIKAKWHGFFSYRHAWVIGEYNQATTTSSVVADVPIGGQSALVGVGMGF